MKEEKISFLDIIFSSLKFYAIDFIQQLQLYYKNKIAISTLDLYQQISAEKFKISTSKTYSDNICKYLHNE